MLTRTERGGRGFKSRPLGASIFGEGISAFSFTFDLHFARFLSATENEFSSFEEPVDDIHVILDPIVDHLLFTVRTNYHQDRRFPW